MSIRHSTRNLPANAITFLIAFACVAAVTARQPAVGASALDESTQTAEADPTPSVTDEEQAGTDSQTTDSQNADSQTTDSPAAATTETPKNNPYALNQKPRLAEGIGVDPQTGVMIPGDIEFDDEENRHVSIGDYFDGTRPVMLSFNYSNCPKLCSVQLQNMVSTLRQVDFKVKQDFQVVSVSIDPNEQTSRAKETKNLYTKQYNRPGTEDGWHFLTGKKADIESLANICGFRYRYVREQKLFSHPPVFILISPDGKIVRYIHGLDYDPKTMEQALIESAEGKIGSAINLLNYGLGCFLFDESTGKYTFQAMAVMRIGGALTALILVGTLVPYWFRRRGSSGELRDDNLELPAKTSTNPS